MASRFEGKVAIVTGASSGIGQSIAERLGSEGASVIIDYRNHIDAANAVKAKIEAAGGKAAAVSADVTIPEQVQNLVEEAYKQFGGCDILVNNAGVERHAPFWEATEADYDLVLGTNLKAAFFLTQRFVQKLMDAKKPGSIINISSVHEDMVFPNFASYCAAKGGLRMLMRDLAMELGPYGITCNNVAPGAINTPINSSLLENKPQLDALLRNIPLGRLGTPEEVAGLVAFLASADAAYITGSTYYIDGGLIRNYKEQ
ncbi:MAG: SDR family NAD(P)-dependent oxidoreductase [Janthinobacterium lividum]